MNMETQVESAQRFSELARKLGASFAERAAAHDADGSFVAENYKALKQHKLFSAGVPADLGGGGASYTELCHFLRELAHGCGSTALALSMHTHLTAAAVWRHRHGQPAEALLRKIVEGELVLVSTGAGDWVDSVGRAERVDGGYKITGVKRFCSGAPAGDLLLTSAPFVDPEKGPEVLHFAVSLRAPGVTVRDDWDTLGMRATGSHSVELADVFVPEPAISLRRPGGHQWHQSWNVVVTVALPLVMSTYVGIAERAAQIAREAAARREADPLTLQLIGEVENCLTTAQMGLREMIAITNDYDIVPTVEDASRGLIRKTITANATIATVSKAVELFGGSAFYRRSGLERLLRDVQGAQFHPLPEKKQLDFTGRVALGLPPV
jgi:alkylation response protein AidB-like acyl-CoA dehydrogenase